MKKYIALLGVALLVLLLFSVLFWFYEARYLVGRASVTVQSFSVDNSYMFVTPLQARADGVENIRVTVFVLSDQGLGVAGKNVVIETNPSLEIDLEQNVTDSFGRASFDIAATQPGDYYQAVVVDGQTLPQKAHLTFN